MFLVKGSKKITGNLHNYVDMNTFANMEKNLSGYRNSANHYNWMYVWLIWTFIICSFLFFVFVCAKFLILQICLPLCFLTIYFWLNSKQVLLSSVHQQRTLLLRIEENPIEWENVTFHDVVRGLFIFNINILNLLFVVFYSVNIICLLISCLEGSNDYPS